MTDTAPVSDAQLTRALDTFRAEVASLRNEVREMRDLTSTAIAAIEVLAARHTDITHLTIAEIARVRGITRNRANYLYRSMLEKVPGKVSGVPIEKVFTAWIPLKVARTAVQKLAAAQKRKVTA